MTAQRKGHVVEDVEVRDQGTRLEQHPHALARLEQLLARELRNALPVEQHVARRRQRLPSDQPQKRRFPTTAGTHDDGDLAPWYLDVDAVEDEPFAAHIAQIPDFHEIVIHIDPGMFSRRTIPQCARPTRRPRRRIAYQRAACSVTGGI
jgi:hypothetical protein